jgi:anti-sigma-K factor RskA
MNDRDEIDWLAAQYALGALPPGERRFVQARIGQDRALATAIDTWELRLAPLSLREPGLAPPPRVLEGVLASIAQRRVSDQLMQVAALPATPAAPERRPRAPRQWTALVAQAAALGVIAIGLGAVLVEQYRQPQDQITGHLAPVKQSSAADEPTRAHGATFAVAFDARSGMLTVRQISGEVARPDRAYVLWVTSGGDADAVVMGRLEPGRPTVLRVDDQSSRQLGQGRLLVTLEAEAWTTRPRGPTIAAGTLTRSK